MLFMPSIRGIISFIVGISFIFGIVYFVALGHTLTEFTHILIAIQLGGWGGLTLLTPALSASVTDYLIRPYTLATASPPAQTFVPIAALAIGGFVTGLIRKHPLNAFFIGVIYAIIIVIAYGVSLIFSGPFNILPSILGLSLSDFFLLFLTPSIMGFIGGILTAI
ncbi:MAG: hypothetical protein ACTSWP_10580 [Candidatus Freyarchaeota archaeon]